MVDSPYQLVLAGFLPSTVVVYDSYPITTKVMNLLGFLEWHISFTTGDFRPLPWHQPYIIYIMAPLTNPHQNYPHPPKKCYYSGLFATIVPCLKPNKLFTPVSAWGFLAGGAMNFQAPNHQGVRSLTTVPFPAGVTSVSGCSNTKSAWLPTIKTKASGAGDPWSNQGTGPA